MTDRHALARDHAAAVLATVDAVREARRGQWERPPIAATLPNDGARGTEGTYSDPTALTATDPDRLRLRAAIVTAEHALADATAALVTATANLRHALGPYGHDFVPHDDTPTARTCACGAPLATRPGSSRPKLGGSRPVPDIRR